MDRNEHIIHENEEGMRVKDILSSAMRLSRRTISRLNAQRSILLNNEPCRLSGTVKTGDRLTVREDSNIEILYEDDDLVIVNKPAGIAAHPQAEDVRNMGTFLKQRYGKDFAVRTCGRLDKPVSGIMVYAKNKETASALSQERQPEVLKKEYLALIQGSFEQDRGRLKYRLAKEKGKRGKRIAEDGQLCITDYETEKKYSGFSLVRVSIVTGRTHQIRSGMSAYGHPLLGDSLYGGSTVLIRRPALHCEHVTLLHPGNGRKIDLHCPLPADMKKILDTEEHYEHQD